MSAWLVVHVFFGTLGFGMAIAFDIVLVAIARSRRTEVVRVTYKTVSRYRPIVGGSFLLAILLGFFIAVVQRDSLVSPWLLASYAVLLAGGATYGLVIQRRTARILAASDAELQEMLGSVSPVGAWVMVTAMAAIIALMTLRPF